MNQRQLDLDLDSDLDFEGPNVLRQHRAEAYEAVRCAAMADSRVSFLARGLLAYLATRPEGTEVSLSDDHLTTLGPDDSRAVHAALDELRSHGYVRMKDGHQFVTDRPDWGRSTSSGT